MGVGVGTGGIRLGRMEGESTRGVNLNWVSSLERGRNWYGVIDQES